jgi:hypothetical protein
MTSLFSSSCKQTSKTRRQPMQTILSKTVFHVFTFAIKIRSVKYYSRILLFMLEFIWLSHNVPAARFPFLTRHHTSWNGRLRRKRATSTLDRAAVQSRDEKSCTKPLVSIFLRHEIKSYWFQYNSYSGALLHCCEQTYQTYATASERKAAGRLRVMDSNCELEIRNVTSLVKVMFVFWNYKFRKPLFDGLSLFQTELNYFIQFSSRIN